MQLPILSMLLCWVVLFGVACGREVHDLRRGHTSWGSMAKKAGYYTSSGVYKGGFPRTVRRTRQESSICTETHLEGGHCIKWATNEADDRVHDYCECKKTESTYCAEWECLQGQTSTSWIEGDVLHCFCSTANAGAYCEKWKCIRYDDSGDIEDATYSCEDANPTGRYCYRWKGDKISNSVVQSAVCECFGDEGTYCDTWLCKERTMKKCTTHSGSWCDMAIAVGVYGVIGAVFVGFSFCACSSAFTPNTKDEESKYILPCVPCAMLIGVCISGGIIGLGYVLLMYSGFFGLLLCIFYRCQKPTNPKEGRIQPVESAKE